MPDFWLGAPAKLDWFLDPSEPNQAAMGKWMEKIAPNLWTPKVQPIMDDAVKHYPNIEKWAMIGYCWGGKMVSLLSANTHTTTPFTCGIQSSPAMVSPADATATKIPMCMLASEEEPVDDVKSYETELGKTGVKYHVETFGGQPHGWMSARADFKDSKSKGEYERGYGIALQFLHDHS